MTGWLLHSLSASALLMALVLAVRPWVARRWGAHAAYALWLLPLARLLCPPLALLPGAPGAATASGHEAVAATGVLASELIVTLIWATGATAFFSIQLLRYRHFLSRTCAAITDRPRHAGGLQILRSAVASGPFAAGLLRRRIVLPADFHQTYAPGERRLVLTHEATHHRRGDLWANLAALLVLALHWFNPLAWLAHRLFRIDQEAACDASVLRRRPADRFRYGVTLAKAGGALPMTLSAFGDQTMLKVRLRRLSRTTAPGTVGATLSLVAGLFLTAGTAIVPRPYDPAFTASLVAASVPPRPSAPTTAPRSISPIPSHPPKTWKREVPARPTNATSAPDVMIALDRAAVRYRPAADLDWMEQGRQTGLERSDARLSQGIEHLAASRGRPIGDPAYLDQRRQQGLAQRAAGLRD